MLRGVQLPGSDGKDLETEVREALAALDDSGLRVDPERGYGIATDAGVGTAMPRVAGWQHEPSKAEWKELAKEYKERKEAGNDSDAALGVLEAALRASGCKAAMKAVGADVEEEEGVEV